MKKINPLYIGAFLLFLLVFSIVELLKTKDEIVQAQADFRETKELALSLHGIKKVYDAKQSQQRTLMQLVNYLKSKGADVSQSSEANSMRISAKELDRKLLDHFIGKLLNTSYKIKSLKIERIDDKKAQLDLEIQW